MHMQKLLFGTTFYTAIYGLCFFFFFSVQPPTEFYYVMVNLDQLCIWLYGRNSVFCALCDMMSKVRKCTEKYRAAICPLWRYIFSARPQTFIVSLTSTFFFVLMQIALDWCVACYCHLFMHQRFRYPLVIFYQCLQEFTKRAVFVFLSLNMFQLR